MDPSAEQSSPWRDLSERDPFTAISNIPTELLYSELSRRHGAVNSAAGAGGDRPACGSKASQENYNTGLHVAGVVIILILSTAACAVPLFARNFSTLPLPRKFLFWCRHFGTGVLLATAFVHLLPTAFISLTDPCLPPFWNQGYPAMPGAIALLSVFLVVAIEMYFLSRGAGHHCDVDILSLHHTKVSHDTDQSEFDGLVVRNTEANRGAQSGRFQSSGASFGSGQSQSAISHERTPSRSTFLSPGGIPKHQRSYSGRHGGLFSPELNTYEMGDLEGSAVLIEPSEREPRSSSSSLDALDPLEESSSRVKHYQSDSNGPEVLAPDEARERDTLQVVLLEAGILFHSIFIGLSLSVTAATSSYLVLLIAISMHQTFEGLALGSRIAAIRFPPFPPVGADSTVLDRIGLFVRRWQPWLMCLAFGVTTPVGQAIGLAVHRLYDPAGQVGLIMVGCTNAVSSGFLLFAGLVSLLAEDFLTDRSYEVLVGGQRRSAFLCVFAGAVSMALVGAWA